MKIYFVRHGKTAYNGTGRMTGQTDIPLIDEGIQQAEEAAGQLPSGISALYSSDLLRCKETAEIFNRKLNLPIQYDPRLRERSFGSLSGKTWKDIDPDGALRAKDVAQQYDYRPHGGESVGDVEKRILDAVEDIKKRHDKDSVVLVVAHAGIIRLLHRVLHNEAHEIIHNSSFHEFEFN